MHSSPRIVIVPGWRNSGPEHWQSLWQAQLPKAQRVQQQDWLVPHRDAWVGALEALLLADERPAVIVAHSLGCITTVHLGAQAAARIQGALLVAPADPERRAQLADFAPVPYAPLPYRSVLVASSNDPFCPIRRAGAYARAWGSELVRLQNAGHINAESGLGVWPLGLALLQSLMSESAWLNPEHADPVSQSLPVSGSHERELDAPAEPRELRTSRESPQPPAMQPELQP